MLPNFESAMKEEEKYLIEVATGFRYVIHVHRIVEGVIHCRACVWVATTGNRAHAFMAEGPSAESEIEDMGPGAMHSIAALVSVFQWNKEMPTTQ